MKCSIKRMLFTGALVLSMVMRMYAQEELKDEQSEPYTASRWYFGSKPFRNGFSFFSTGYNYYYQNFDIDIKLFDVGRNSAVKEFYMGSRFRILFYGLASISTGYNLFFAPANLAKGYKLLQHVGQFEIGWRPNNFVVHNTSNIGLMNLYTQKNDELQSMRIVNNTSTIKALLVDIPNSFFIYASTKFLYDYAIDHNESLYEVYFDTALVQSHGFGQLALKPFVSYSDSIKSVSTIKPSKNLLRNMNFSIFGPVSFYNFAGGALLEYRFYFLSFLKRYKWYESLYISATYNIAYLKENKTEKEDVKMYYGGGLGFSIFSSFPLSVQFIIDEDFNMGFSIVSGVIPLY